MMRTIYFSLIYSYSIGVTNKNKTMYEDEDAMTFENKQQKTKNKHQQILHQKVA